jgi:hypothetical protein
LIYVIVLVGGAAISVRWGIAGVATTTAAAVTLLWIQNNYLAIRVSRIPLSDVLRAHVPGLVLVIIVVACAWPTAVLLRSFGLNAAAIFAIVMLLAVGICIVAVMLAMRARRGDFVWLAGELQRFLRRTTRRRT